MSRPSAWPMVFSQYTRSCLLFDSPIGDACPKNLCRRCGFRHKAETAEACIINLRDSPSIYPALMIAMRLGINGRWHDNRHTFITDLAESGEASDEAIEQLAGHVSKQMLKHFSHIRMEAKRRAVDSLVVKTDKKGFSVEYPTVPPKVSRLN